MTVPGALDHGMLRTTDGARIYSETSGNPDGVPLLWLHGGPGSGLGSGRYRHDADSDWYVVGLDQRACGRSRPLVIEPGFDLGTLTTQAIIDDIERLRGHLGIEQWVVVGGAAAASAWCAWEDAHMSLLTPGARDLVDRDPAFREVFALQVAHNWANNAFLGEDGVYEHLERIRHLPAFLVHGRLDVSGPLGMAWRLHREWPGSTLTVVDDEGHGGAGLSAALRGALGALLPLVRTGF
jgi:pimeloyl-ACP methyl ester carboxylesterase